MKPVAGRWLAVVVCCAFAAAAAAAPDNVLRFLSHKEVVRMAQESQQKQSEEQAAVPKVEFVRCADNTSECPDGTTCCQLSSGTFGCCPFPKAVCCKDGLHCCPSGTTCDVAHGSCQRGDFFVPWEEKVPARQRVESVDCRDKTQCPDGNTCCELPGGGYGCCPLPDAVCCKDGLHCCPSGTTCDVAHGSCQRGDFFVPWEEKVPARQRVESVECRDETQCPDGNTCCELPSGGYGCCPLPDAVCCTDGDHCCPSGYTCDLARQTCDKGQTSVPWTRKVPALSSPKSIVCPDQTTQCPDNSTCCKLASGNYGCCPLPHAVCCSDGVHCCPEGYTCDVAKGTCDQGQESVPLVKKVPAIRSPQNTVCPDQTQCPDNSTCCKLSSGSYGCCPLPHAVCCSDGVHCCPEGYTCDVAKGTCDQGQESVPLVKKVPAIQSPQAVVCPDKTSQCPDGSTCCKLASGKYGCCPMPQAVCCSDGIHCCPHSYTCDVAKGTCDKGEESVQLVKKMPAIQSPQNTVCPDQTECPDDNTCCKLASGTYGCCPLPHAVCCSDGAHCCPQGYTCDVAAGSCKKGLYSLALMKKVSSVQSLP